MESPTVATMRELRLSELSEAAGLLGRAMCNNPANLRAFAIPDAKRRIRALERFFIPVLHGLYRRGPILGAFRGCTLVGVCGMARPGLCQPTPLEKLSAIPSVVCGNPLGTALRVRQWVGEWARRDPPEPHWHLGPVGVDTHVQGQGIGSAMLAVSCARTDADRMPAYLETDKIENVGFYKKFGFRVIAEAEVLGEPNWFMSRAGRI